MGNIEFIKNMQILELKEDDLLILKIKNSLSTEKLEKITKEIKNKIPEKLKNKIGILILEENIDIGIIRQEEVGLI
jgi:hypothetical protein